MATNTGIYGGLVVSKNTSSSPLHHEDKSCLPSSPTDIDHLSETIESLKASSDVHCSYHVMLFIYEQMQKHINSSGSLANLLSNQSLIALFQHLSSLLGEEQNMECKKVCLLILTEFMSHFTRNEDTLVHLFTPILPQFIPHLASGNVTLRRYTIQCARAYLRHIPTGRESFMQYLVQYGIGNVNQLDVQRECLLTFPFLLTHDLMETDLSPLVTCLAHHTMNTDSEESLKRVSEKHLNSIRVLVGEERYKRFLQKLPDELQEMPNSSLQGKTTKSSQQCIETAFGVLPLEVVRHLNSRTHMPTRFKAIEQCKSILNGLANIRPLLPHFHSFFSFLESLLKDENFKIMSCTLEILVILASRLSDCQCSNTLSEAEKYSFFELCSYHLGEQHQLVRRQLTSLHINIMHSFGVSKVMDFLCERLTSCIFKMKLEILNIFMVALLTFPSGSFDLYKLMEVVLPCGLDNRKTIRYAAMECVALIAQNLGSEHFSHILQLLDSLSDLPVSSEISVEEVTLYRRAVLARLARRQLPRLNCDGLVEYATLSKPVKITSTPRPGVSNVIQLADVEWILNKNQGTINNEPRAISASKDKLKLPWEEKSLKTKTNDSLGRDKEMTTSQQCSSTLASSNIPPISHSTKFPRASHSFQTKPNHSDEDLIAAATQPDFFVDLQSSLNGIRSSASRRKALRKNKTEDSCDNSLLDNVPVIGSDTRKSQSAHASFGHAAASQLTNTQEVNGTPHPCMTSYTDNHLKKSLSAKSHHPKRRAPVGRKTRSSSWFQGQQLGFPFSDSMSRLFQPVIRRAMASYSPITVLDSTDSSEPTRLLPVKAKPLPNKELNPVQTSSPKTLSDNSRKSFYLENDPQQLEQQEREKKIRDTTRQRLQRMKRTVDPLTTPVVGERVWSDFSPILPSLESDGKNSFENRSLNTKRSVSYPCLEKYDGGGGDDLTTVTMSREQHPCPESVHSRRSKGSLGDVAMNRQKCSVLSWESALQVLNEEDWERKCSALVSIQELAVYQSDQLPPVDVHRLCLALIKECKNLRSQVSRAAIQTVGDLFLHLSRILDFEIESLCHCLLHKYGEKNDFICEDVNRALDSLCHHCNPLRVCAALTHSSILTHRNAQIRCCAALHLSALVCEVLTIERIFSNGSKDKEPNPLAEKILPAASKLITDAHPDARYYGRKVFFSLMNHPQLMKQCQKYVEENQMRKVLETLNQLTEKGLGEMPRNTLSGASSRSRYSIVRSISGSSSMGTISTSSAPLTRESQELENDVKMQGSHTTGHSPVRLIKIAGSKKNSKAQNNSNDSGSNLEMLKQLQTRLSASDWRERLDGLEQLEELAQYNSLILNQNIIKIFDELIPRLTDSNTNVNKSALQCLQNILPFIRDQHVNQVYPVLVQSVLQNLTSKSPAIAALAGDIVNDLISSFEASLALQALVQTTANINVKHKPIILDKITSLLHHMQTLPGAGGGPRSKLRMLQMHLLPEVVQLLHLSLNQPHLLPSLQLLVEATHNHMGDEFIPSLRQQVNIKPEMINLVQRMLSESHSHLVAR